jgi:protein ImuB
VVYDGSAFCAALPVAALEPDARTLSILEDWGIRTIGDLLRLPKADVVSRLGAEAEKMWKRASGRSKRALRLPRPLESFVEAFEFEYAVETTEPLMFLLRRFLDSLCARIRDQHRVVGRMRFTLPLDDAGKHEREFAVPAPTTSVDVLFRIIDTHVETLRLEQQPVGIRLELLAAAPLGRQLALFEKGLRDPNGFGETLARLQAVVGDGGVGMPSIANSHRPDACMMAEFDEAASSASVPIQFGLPLRRLRPPSPIGVRISNSEPAWVDAPGWGGPVVRAGGPYRFSGEWWAGAPWAIEEWDVQIDGRGLVRLGLRENCWTIEGIYNLAHGSQLH